jgi:competence protein ComEC
MDSLELLLFNVDHGLSLALIERPEGYVTLIDLGSNSDLSPIKYLTDNLGLRTDLLFITHPHGDHLSDINNARKEKYYPLSINYQTYDWDDVKKREKKESQHLIDSYRSLIMNVKMKEYYGNAELKYWRYTPEKAKEIFGESKYINNSSLFIIYKWKDFKIAIPGDLESDAMINFCGCKEFVDFAKNCDLLIAPHHGHKEGFCSQWVNTIGKPYMTLISIQERDQNIATSYQSPDFAKGVVFNGATKYTLTTRSYGSIKAVMFYDSENKPAWNFTSF